MTTRLVGRAFGTALALAVLAGCGSGLQPPMATPGSVSAEVALPDAATPPACKKQKKTKQYASAAETLSTKNGSLCIPAFHDFGGTLNYPGVGASSPVTVTSSTTNYANIPGQPAGAIFYLNLSPSGTTQFGSTVKPGGGLEGKAIKAHTTYTAVLEGNKFGFWYSGLGSCYGVAKAGKDGGVISGIGSILKGQQIGGEGYSQFEIFVYEGTSSGTKC